MSIGAVLVEHGMAEPPCSAAALNDANKQWMIEMNHPGILISNRQRSWQVDAASDLWSHPDLDPAIDNYPEIDGQAFSARYFEAETPEEASQMFIERAKILSTMKRGLK